MKIEVTKLPTDQWKKYRAIRLAALKADPQAFGSSYEEEIDLPEADWHSRINAMWFAIVDGQVVGLIGLLQRENHANKHCGCIISFWVKPSFRGYGVGKSLIQNVQQNAKSLGIKKISLNVSTTQANAKSLYESTGFKEVCIFKENLLKDSVYLDEYYMEWFAP